MCDLGRFAIHTSRKRLIELQRKLQADGKPYRAFAWAFVILYAFFTIIKTKDYWLSPAYPVLFAAGCYAVQRLVEHRPRLAWLRIASLLIITVTGLLLVPFTMPILPMDAFIRYSNSAALPQSFADRQGWREIWTYDRGAAAPRELEFLNGRLIAISPQPDALRVASVGN